VVLFRALNAERRSRLRGNRPARVEAGATEPEPVPITRATVIAAQPFDGAEAAAAWLAGCRKPDAAVADVEQAVELVNRAVGAHRVAAQDPRVRDVVAGDAQRVRLGYGSGDEVVAGSWRDCYAIPPGRASRRKRKRMLSPQEEMAGMLSGRRQGVLPSEELLLRARLDLDHGRLTEAALVTRAAVDALSAEGQGGGHSAAAEQLARTALGAGLGPEDAGELEELVVALERAVRRRRYADDS
jgi:hypothetical protein